MFQKKTLIPNKKVLLGFIHQTLTSGGWFKERRHIEDLSKALGKKVRRGKLDLDRTVEYID